MARIAADPRYVAVIGPFHSFVAESSIPVANAAGLLQCSPSNTTPGLTRVAEAASLRPRPDRPSYVRLATTDDTAAGAAARLHPRSSSTRAASSSSRRLRRGRAAGRRSSSMPSKTWAARSRAGRDRRGRGRAGRGGKRRSRRAGPQPSSSTARLSKALACWPALSSAGADLPFVGLDIILDGPRSASGSFLDVAGSGAQQRLRRLSDRRRSHPGLAGRGGVPVGIRPSTRELRAGRVRLRQRHPRCHRATRRSATGRRRRLAGGPQGRGHDARSPVRDGHRDRSRSMRTGMRNRSGSRSTAAMRTPAIGRSGRCWSSAPAADRPAITGRR